MSLRENPGSGSNNNGVEHGRFRREQSAHMDIPLQQRAPESRRRTHSQNVGAGLSHRNNSQKKTRAEKWSGDDAYNNELNSTYTVPKGTDIAVPVYKPRNGRPASASSSQTFVIRPDDDRRKLIKNEATATPTNIKLDGQKNIMSDDCQPGECKKGRILDVREIHKKARKTLLNEVSNLRLMGFWIPTKIKPIHSQQIRTFGCQARLPPERTSSFITIISKTHPQIFFP